MGAGTGAPERVLTQVEKGQNPRFLRWHKPFDSQETIMLNKPQPKTHPDLSTSARADGSKNQTQNSGLDHMEDITLILYDI
jgi:hypothetical protein